MNRVAKSDLVAKNRNKSGRRSRIPAIPVLLWLAISVVALPATQAWGQATVTRGPYLQMATDSSIVVRWRTDQATDSSVSFGTVQGSLPSAVTDATLTVDHEITLNALAADTRYFYAVGTTLDILAGDDGDHFFVTSPVTATAKPSRILVVGDSGTAHQQQLDPLLGEVRDAQGVRDSFLAYSGTGATLIAYGADWKFLDDGSDQGTAWRSPAFNDTSWSSGPSELGCGDGDEATSVNASLPPTCDPNGLITVYFRHAFDVADAALVTSLTLSLLRDDGAVAYLNGTEVVRSNMPAGAIDFTTLASQNVGSTGEHIFHTDSVDPGLLVDGTNVLAIELHQFNPNSTDISFNLELFGQLAGGTPADLWLTLGDNAYNFGTDDEWQQAVFNPYPTLLRNTVLWPALGNHDTQTSNGAPYLDAMTLPTNAEAGGIASGTERYYSFDHGNIHFIVLDSDDAASRLPGSAMLLWLASDLAATTQDWSIAYWHHPPYSDGTHKSDTETELIQIRENVLQILEDGGVDLVLSGHSHAYERSPLVDGFYLTPTTIFDGTLVDSGDGCVVTGCDGPYNKPAPGPGPHEGTVYAVVGNSGRNFPVASPLNHPLMISSVNDLGSMIIDIDGDRLDATAINRNCATRGDASCVLDSFTIVKGTIQPVYLGLSSSVTSVAPGGTFPFMFKLENISNQIQSFGFVLTLEPPTGGSLTLAEAPITLPSLAGGSAELGLPLPVGVPLGTWTLRAIAGQPGIGLIENLEVHFTVE